MSERVFPYEVVLGIYQGMKIAGPKARIGPSNAELDEVYAAMRTIDDVARRVGLTVEAVVLRKAEGT